MKRFTLKQLYRVLGQALKKLPFIITYHGKPKAVVMDYDEFLKTQPTVDDYNEVEQ